MCKRNRNGMQEPPRNEVVFVFATHLGNNQRVPYADWNILSPPRQPCLLVIVQHQCFLLCPPHIVPWTLGLNGGYKWYDQRGWVLACDNVAFAIDTRRIIIWNDITILVKVSMVFVNSPKLGVRFTLQIHRRLVFNC